MEDQIHEAVFVLRLREGERKKAADAGHKGGGVEEGDRELPVVVLKVCGVNERLVGGGIGKVWVRNGGVDDGGALGRDFDRVSADVHVEKFAEGDSRAADSGKWTAPLDGQFVAFTVLAEMDGGAWIADNEDVLQVCHLPEPQYSADFDQVIENLRDLQLGIGIYNFSSSSFYSAPAIVDDSLIQ
jgi:hypothetical protein